MTIKTASQQDTYAHIFESGALQWEWWLEAKTIGLKGSDLDVPKGWQVEVTAETGDDPESKTVIVDHKLIIKTARYVLANKGKQRHTPQGSAYPAWSQVLERVYQSGLQRR